MNYEINTLVKVISIGHHKNEMYWLLYNTSQQLQVSHFYFWEGIYISCFPQNEITGCEKLPNIFCFNEEYLHGGLLPSTSLNQASASQSPL